jgi:CGNR zinc finger protein
MVNTQVAPDELEPIRELLNTWLIPNDTRMPTDTFTGSADLRTLRDDLREAVESGAYDGLNRWITKLHIRPVLGGEGLAWRGRGEPARVLTAVLNAMTDGTWDRLKACPDCRWVFYDNTRNASKRWCLMTAGSPRGRSCGSIAKVRAYRSRAAAGV